MAFEVLQASNYLQMDSVQAQSAEYLKTLVSKSNFLTVYDFAVLRGIKNLSSYIMSTIIKPAEVILNIFKYFKVPLTSKVMRKRKYGPFDLILKMGQLEFNCHSYVLANMSSRIKNVLQEKRQLENDEMLVEVLNEDAAMICCSEFGISGEQLQTFYNAFENVYLGREVSEESFTGLEDSCNA